MAETKSVAGAVLRPGDHGFGGDDAERVRMYIDRVRAYLGPDCPLAMRENR